MRWPWSKPKPPEKEYSMVYDTKLFNTGISTVYVVFSDGREVETKFYGDIDQYVPYRDVTTETKFSEPYVMNSHYRAAQWIGELKPGEQIKIVDDSRNITVAWIGMVHHAEIVKTEELMISYTFVTGIKEK